MREKAAQGVFPGHAPLGYQNNRAERTIEIDPIDSPIVERIFALYATGAHSISTLKQAIKSETGKIIARSYLHSILQNRFYVGFFEWGGEIYLGTHPLFLSQALFDQVQLVLSGHHRPEYAKRQLAFRGLMRCAYDGCVVTGDIHKEKYVYYYCTGNRGRCDLPRFREEDIAQRLGEPLKGLQMPQEAISQIVSGLRQDQRYTVGKRRTEHIQRVFELANNAYSLYVSRDLMQKASLLKMLFSSCYVDAATVKPTFRKPFDLIVERASLEEWSQYLEEGAYAIGGGFLDDSSALQETR